MDMLFRPLCGIDADLVDDDIGVFIQCRACSREKLETRSRIKAGRNNVARMDNRSSSGVLGVPVLGSQGNGACYRGNGRCQRDRWLSGCGRWSRRVVGCASSTQKAEEEEEGQE